jgi:hypothetical protein
MNVMYGTKYAWTIVQVVPDYPHVLVTFADGTYHSFDLSYLFDKGPAFRPIADRDFFARVGIIGGALTWPNETDIAPDAMYMEATGHSGW